MTLTALALFLASAFLLAIPACTYTGGELLFALGVGQGKKIPAECDLTKGRLMIFIDDIHERIDWPPARAYLFDELSQELLRNKAATKIIPQETVDALRRSMPNFNKLTAREIGELVGADQVLWIETKEFFADETFIDAGDAAYWTITIKVLNPHEKKDRTKVRIWPSSPAGDTVRGRMTGAAVAQAKTKDGISKKLASNLAEHVAKLFYDHRAGEFDGPDHKPLNEPETESKE